MELTVTKKIEFIVKQSDLDEILKVYFKEHHDVCISGIFTHIKNDGAGGYVLDYIECSQVDKSTIKQ